MTTQSKKIRVLVVDDSLVARMTIIEALNKNPLFEVVGYAVDAGDAQTKILRLCPDVVTMDVEMPGRSGIEFLKEFLPRHPLPVILVSSLGLRVFDALAAGAIDFVRKPDSTHNKDVFLRSLAEKLMIASCARVQSRTATHLAPPAATTMPFPPKRSAKPSPPHPLCLTKNQFIIAIGASTGGTEATLEILRNLPADSPGVLIVQHMPTGFTRMYADRLNSLCHMKVQEARNGDTILPGTAFVAPADLQLRVMRSGGTYTISCLAGEKVSGHRPSVDVLFQSMADNVTCDMIGIILTGMGGDGAKGLLAMKKAGAYTIGQDEQSCVVYGMPKVAHDIGAVTVQSPCNSIAPLIKHHLQKL